MRAESAIRYVFGGLIATGGVTFLAYLGPLVGLPVIDPAAFLVEVFGGSAVQGGKQWWVGLALYFLIGMFALPAALAFGLDRIFALNRGVAGLGLGIGLYLCLSSVLMPFTGQGFFARYSTDPLLFNFATLASALLYGSILAISSIPEEEVPPIRSVENRRRAA